MWKKILVPLDGSSFADDALAFALDLAAHSDAAIIAETVVDPHSLVGLYPQGTPTLLAQLREDADTILHEAAQRCVARGVRCETVVDFNGPVADAIVTAAEKRGADAIVMGTHGRSGFAKAVMGSVAQGVLERAGCAVLVIRPEHPQHAHKRAAHA